MNFPPLPSVQSPVLQGNGFTQWWFTWLSNVQTVLTGPFQLSVYVVAGLPSATTAGQLIYVSDAATGAIPAFSDGTNWRRVDTRAIVT